MSLRGATGCLFIAMLVVVPLPLLGLEGSSVPVLRYVQLAAALSILAILEGTAGMVALFLGLLWGHALAFGLLLLLAAALLSRFVIGRLPEARRTWAVVAAVVVLLGWGAFGARYDTQFHHSDAHASLLEMYR